MSARVKYAGVLAAGYGLILGLLAFCAAAVWSGLEERERVVIAQILDERAGLVAMVALVTLAGIGIVMDLLYRRYVVAPNQLAEEVRIIVSGNPAHRVTPSGPEELRRLAQSINDLAGRASEQLAQVQAGIDTATAKLDEERNRLAALMSELAFSVLVCNSEGRILLYNSRAKNLLEQRDAGSSYVGLGRSLSSVIERKQLAHAQERIDEQLAKGEANPVAKFVTSTSAAMLVRVQMAPVRGRSGAQAGFVLTLEDITAEIESGARRDALLLAFTEGNRHALANIRAAVETISAFPEMDGAQKDAFVGIIGEETGRLSTHLEQVVKEHGDILKTQWPLEEMSGAELVQLAQRRIKAELGLESHCDPIDAGVWLKVDSYWLTLALASIAQWLRDELKVGAIRFRLASAGAFANLDLIWPGAQVGAEILKHWEVEPLRVGKELARLSLRDVIERHGGEAWYQHNLADGTGCYRLTLPVAPAAKKAAALPSGRPEYYDFDLFGRAGASSELDERPLSALSYTVFDTETTGLDPSAGDEIISIGAVRIVNGRLLRHEVFDQLVDAQRSIASEAIAVHGIEPAMLVGQPTIATVLPAFARFCEDTVLVAHNAAFDMRFLQLKEAQTGVRFAQPVLDTLLLSAVIHPTLQEHGLEAVARRFGVQVTGRHTALGDAVVAGEILLKMLPLLAEKGIRTLREAREAAQKTYYARLAY